MQNAKSLAAPPAGGSAVRIWEVRVSVGYKGWSGTMLGLVRSMDAGILAADRHHHSLHPHCKSYPENHPIHKCCRARWERDGDRAFKKFTDDDVVYEYSVTPARFLDATEGPAHAPDGAGASDNEGSGR